MDTNARTVVNIKGVKPWGLNQPYSYDPSIGGAVPQSPGTNCTVGSYKYVRGRNVHHTTSFRNGIYYKAVQGPSTSNYDLAVMGYSHRRVEPTGGDLGRCTNPGVLRAGRDSATGNIGEQDRDAYLVYLYTGNRYRIDVKGSSSNSGSLSDPPLILIYPDGSVDQSSASNHGTGKDERWSMDVTTTNSYLLVVSAATHGPTGTYTIDVWHSR